MNRQSRFPVYDTGYLKNAGSFAMAVDGSTVSKTFQFAPLSGVWAVSRIGVLIVDPGTTTPTNFGALGTLTNGIKLEMKTQGITQVVQTLKDNVDLTMVFSHNKMTTQLLDTLSAPVGWLNKIDYFCGELINDV